MREPPVLWQKGQVEGPCGCREDGLWRSGQDPKDERQVKGVLGVLPDREEVVRKGVNEDTMEIRNHGRQSVTKCTVQTRTDFSGEPPWLLRAMRDTHVGRERDREREKSRRAPV